MLRILVLSLLLQLGTSNRDQLNEDGTLRTPELIIKYGYLAESHNVTTADGYILTHHRIPHGKTNQEATDKPVVLLHHGLLGSSSDWILRTPPNAIAYILADKGYDVWLLNTRGNEYSLRHVTFDPVRNRRQFWNFSWNEMAMYDLPNSIDYILNTTGQVKVFHIGHSQGTTVLYVMLSEKPEYGDKIITHISYSPIAYHKHSLSIVFRSLAPLEALGELALLKWLYGDFNFAPSTEAFKRITSVACRDGEPFQFVCSGIFFMLMGYNPEQLNTTMLPVIYGHFPAGSSTMQLRHYVQLVNSGKFRKFDYGLLGNYDRYNQWNPPDYKISNIKIPIYTFYGGKDYFAQLPDVEKFLGLLPNLKEKHFIKSWAHMDYFYGIDAIQEVYNKTLSILYVYSNI